MTVTSTKKVLIVDDNPADLMVLSESLEDFKDKIVIADEAKSGYEAIEKIEESAENLDLVFLDIEMPGPNGLEVAKMILDHDNAPKIIFVTGRQDLALQAFDVNAIDYVTKPIQKDRLKQSLDKFFAQESSNESLSANVDQLIAQSSNDKTKSSKIAVKDYNERTIRFIDMEDIVCVQRENRRVVIYTYNNNFPTYFSIDKLEQRLASKSIFKANQGALVNIDYVEHMVPNGDGTYDLVFKNLKDRVISVSRSYSKALLQSLGI